MDSFLRRPIVFSQRRTKYGYSLHIRIWHLHIRFACGKPIYLVYFNRFGIHLDKFKGVGGRLVFRLRPFEVRWEVQLIRKKGQSRKIKTLCCPKCGFEASHHTFYWGGGKRREGDEDA